MRTAPRRVAIALLTLAVAAPSPSGPRASAAAPFVHNLAAPAVRAAQSIRFERNDGQYDASVRFTARAGRNRVFLMDDGGSVVLVAPPAKSPSGERGFGICEPPRGYDFSAVAVRFVGERAVAPPRADEPLDGTTSYFLGDDPSLWRTDVPAFGRVRFDGIYRGVDVVYYGTSKGELEYDLVVAPGADPSVIAIAVEGAPVAIASDGALEINTPAGQVRYAAPVVYQETTENRRLVAGRYVLRADATIGFELGAYDRSLPLVIDPVLAFSTYVGGAGFDTVTTVALGPDGRLYLAGDTTSPSLPGGVPLPGTVRGESDVLVARVNEARDGFDFVVIAGGSEADSAAGLGVTTTHEALLKVNTFSTNFPMVQPAQGTAGGEGDIAVLRLAPAGDRLVFSTYLGGSAFENCYTGIAVDAGGNAYVSGCTVSRDFPVRNAFQTTIGGDYDATLAKFTPQGQIVFSTFLGGTFNDAGYGVDVDSTGAIYIAGQTNSADFPAMNGFDLSHNGLSDGFFAKVRPDGSGLVYATFVGGSGDDYLHRIRVDARGAVTAPGTTESRDYPTSKPAQSSFGGGDADAMITRLSPDGRTLEFSSYFGGAGDDGGFGLALDGLGASYLVGETSSTNLRTLDAIQPAFGGGDLDLYVAKFTPEGMLDYSTYLGGSGFEAANDAVADRTGSVVLAAWTNSPNFRLARPILSAPPGGDLDGIVAVLTDSFSLRWEPPKDENPESPPENLEAFRSGAAAPAATLSSLREDVESYEIYSSSKPGVTPSSETFVVSVPASSLTVPNMPGGNYYTVTAKRRGGSESKPSKEAGAGVGGPVVAKLKLKPTKVVATGSGFTSTVDVFINGIAFAAPAAVKKSNTKVVQAGTLANGQTISQYRAANPGRVAVIFRNRNGGLTLVIAE